MKKDSHKAHDARILRTHFKQQPEPDMPYTVADLMADISKSNNGRVFFSPIDIGRLAAGREAVKQGLATTYTYGNTTYFAKAA